MRSRFNTLLLGIAALLVSSCASRELTAPPAGTDTFGYIKNQEGSPIKGVVVTDGFTTTTTDAKGLYAFDRTDSATFVYYSLPAGYRVNTEEPHNTPTFFKAAADSLSRYDFTLTALASTEDRFDLICIGDPQVTTEAHVDRFRDEVAPDILSYVNSAGVPCYAITLGDIVNNTWHLYPSIVEAISPKRIGTSAHQTIGNHDHEYPVSDDQASRKIYESFYGPSNYSFNRGKAHIISMDNIQHGCQKSAIYEAGFTEEQYNWLKEDLSYVPKDHLIIFCAHIPFREGAPSKGGSMNYDKYYSEVLALLAQYDHVEMMAAHTHTNFNYIHNIDGKQIIEHVVGTSCGAWWKSTICGDGTPIGYGVFSIDGDDVKWIYKSVNHDAAFQMRLYRSTDIFTGGDKSVSTAVDSAAPSRIVANVWNWDPEWSVKVYENDLYSGDMTRFSIADPWAKAYHIGVQKGSEALARTNDHMFYYDLKEKSAKVRVEATDRFGNIYNQSTFTDPASSAGEYHENF